MDTYLSANTRLRELREAAGLGQEALAHAAGLDRKTVNRIEGGVHRPLLDQILLLAAALDQAPYEPFRWRDYAQA